MENSIWTVISSTAGILVQLVFVFLIMLRPHREPASRIAWLAVVLALPIVGIILYLILGDTSIGRKAIKRRHIVKEELLEASGDRPVEIDGVPEPYRHLFETGRAVNGFPAVGGNSGELLESSEAGIDAMVKDMDGAEDHIHVLFYIWLSDNSGLKVAEALKRAARRGVTCRVMADFIGSRNFIRSRHWKEMKSAGVRLVSALPLEGNLNPRNRRRADLRNHRKIIVVDNRVTYCGSQNCADAEFRVKKRFAPWVDILVRFEGPIALQNQMLFASDWLAESDEEFPPRETWSGKPGDGSGIVAQVIGTGPTVRPTAMPEVFSILIYAAREELTVTTPYFVPNAPLLAALCACARRGVRTTVVFPHRNDSIYTGAASRSTYPDLLDAGVRICEYTKGLLHTKSITVDGEVSLIGSANMDRRSFDLNYENNMLIYDPALTKTIRQRQEEYINDSIIVSAVDVEQWSILRRFWYNFAALLGPVL